MGRWPDVKTRFYQKFKKTNSCWIWTGMMNKDYGSFWFNNKIGAIIASRASWLIHIGDIPNGKVICHKCDNPSCVNPDHLFLGSYLDNNRDKIKKSRDKRGSKISNSKLNETDIPKIRKMREKGLTYREISEIFGVCQYTIYSIIKGWTWDHVG